MSRRPSTDPRSPVQEGSTTRVVLTVLIAGIIAIMVWSWQQDWTDDLPREGQSAVATSRQGERSRPDAAPSPGPARARANLAAYVTADDYPADAIRNEQQGTVAFILTVSPEGRVAACRVAASSRSTVLDATTCRILSSRARFEPARDAQNRPVADEVHGRIRWVLPDG